MMPTTRTYAAAATGAQVPLSVDYMPLSKITAVVVANTPADTYALQVTLDNVFDQDDVNYVPAASARWLPITGGPTTASGYVTFDGPWRAVRLNIVANTSGIIFSLAQAVTPRA